MTLASAALERPAKWIAALTAITIVMALGVVRIRLRTDGAALYPTGNSVVERMRSDRATFREPEIVVVLATARTPGPAIASKAGLKALKELHTEIDALPGVRSGEVRSLASLVDPGRGQTIVEVPNLLDALPRTDAELQAVLARVASSRLGHGLFLSHDGREAAIYVPLVPTVDRGAFLAKLANWLTARPRPEFELALTGSVAAEVTLGHVVVQDLARLVPIVVLVIAGLALVALRSVGATLISMTKVGVVLTWTLGVMGWTGTPVTIVTTVLPVVLLTMSVTDEFHLFELLRSHLTSGQPRDAALRATFVDLVRPIVLTSLTTAVGLLAFTCTSIAPLRDFGVFAALGIMIALFATLTLVLALATPLPQRAMWRAATFRDTPSSVRPAPRLLGAISASASAGVILLAAPGILRIESRDSWLENLDADSSLVVATHAFDRAFWGSYRYDVVLSADELAYFQFPRGLSAAEKVVALLRDTPHVRGVASYLDAYETRAEVEGLSTPVSALPYEAVRRISADLMVIQSRIDLQQYLSADGRSVRVRLFVPNADFARTREIEAYLDRTLPGALAGSEVRFHRSGDLAAAQAAVRSIVMNVVGSTAWSVLGVAAILAIALRSVRRALVCLVPMAAGIAILIGAMGYLRIPLGIATGMFAAIAIGVGVDFGIHALHAYERARGAGLGHRVALGQMIARAGRSIVWNTVVLAAGVAVLALSSLPPNRRLGLLLAGSLILCCGMTLLLLPWPLAALPPRTART